MVPPKDAIRASDGLKLSHVWDDPAWYGKVLVVPGSFLDCSIPSHGRPWLGAVVVQGCRDCSGEAREALAMWGVPVVQEVAEVSQLDKLVCREPEGEWCTRPWKIYGDGPHLVIYDLGARGDLFSIIARSRCSATVVPWWYPAEELGRMAPSAIVVAGGPYVPSLCDQAIRAVQRFLGRCTVVGLGLGHVVVGMAIGASVAKLEPGHWGKGIKVTDLRSGACIDTIQAHDLCLEGESLKRVGAAVTHVNADDGSVEGFAHEGCKAFGLQFFDEKSLREILSLE